MGMSDGDDLGQEEKPVATFESNSTITFGRDSANDVTLADDWVSPRHAQIEKRDEYVLVDLGSNSGIHHNGKRVSQTVLKNDDVFAIGRHDFVFRTDGVYRSVRDDSRNPILIEAYDLTVQVHNRSEPWPRRRRLDALIDDVSFVVRRGTLLGVVGPSGSGKSTLLKAITGAQPATQGRLLFRQEDLYRDPGPHRGIGMVPQEDIMHVQLGVRRALRFAAALRCPRGLGRRHRVERVDEVARMLDLDRQLRLPIEKLSGGQRKRTSVAMELLTVPSLLCLDEPTSGLDPALDRDVMGGLRDLANDEKTVIVATHNPLHLDACDYVLVMCMGRMAYFGPPGAELFEFFAPAEAYSDVFSAITDEPEVWAQRYRTSPVFGRYVGQEQLRLLQQEARRRGEDAAGRAAAAAPAGGATILSRRSGRRGGVRPSPAPVRPAGGRHDRPPTPMHQFATLCLRMGSLIAADRKYALLMLGLPLALAALSRLVPGHKGLSPDPEGFSLEANRLLIVLITGAAFMGIAAPIREMINEAAIYRRERAVGLSPTAYLLSKVFVFTIVDCVQAFIFVYLALLGRGAPSQALVLPDATLEIMTAVALVAIVSTALGLLISALVRRVEQTTPYLVVSVMAQLILSGALFQITDQAAVEAIAWFDPSRWGYAAAAATTDLVRFPFDDPMWHHTPANWWWSVIVLCAQIVALLLATRWALTRHEHGRPA